VPEYIDFESAIEPSDFSSSRGSQDRDELYPELLDFLDTVEDVSISMLQRRFRVGFNRAARLIEHLEEDGLLAPAQAGKPRKILKS
jgi:S-DNA-T family DNA segregation ATPase FtsK/SpoIIIE